MKIGDTVTISGHKCFTGEIVYFRGGNVYVQVPQFSVPIMCYPDELEPAEPEPVRRGRKFRLLLLAVITLVVAVASYLIADGWRI
ncbi:MAG: hypothetical protein WC547_01140 [Candidatus Omnitrophota bacterium]